MKCIFFTKVCLVRLSSNRSPLSKVENNRYYYGSILHIPQIIKAHKQINLSVYVLFLRENRNREVNPKICKSKNLQITRRRVRGPSVRRSSCRR